MEKVKLGSLCITKKDKVFKAVEGMFLVKKGTFVTVCDIDGIDEGYVFVESEKFPIILDYDLIDLIVIKN